MAKPRLSPEFPTKSFKFVMQFFRDQEYDKLLPIHAKLSAKIQKQVNEDKVTCKQQLDQLQQKLQAANKQQELADSESRDCEATQCAPNPHAQPASRQRPNVLSGGIKRKMIPISKELSEIRKRQSGIRFVCSELQKQVQEASDAYRAARNEDKHMQYLLDVSPFLNEYHMLKAELLDLQSKSVESNPLSKPVQSKLNSLYLQFLRQFSPADMTAVQKRKFDVPPDLDICEECGGEIIHDENSTVCSKCGFTVSDKIIDNDIDHCSYDIRSQVNTGMRPYTYKRLNHLRELMRQMQAKGMANIPDAVYDLLKTEFCKCYTPSHLITPEAVKAKLKKLKLAKFYEHTETITHGLNSQYVPLEIPTEKEEMICFMFMLSEEPFEAIKHQIHADRKNFMSYPFVLYKIAQMLGFYEILPHITLLKSSSLLMNQNRWWEAVCKQRGWEFIVTIGNINRNVMAAIATVVGPAEAAVAVAAPVKQLSEIKM